MRHVTQLTATLIVAISTPAAPIAAQSAIPTQARDPNEKVCETVLQVGSRLSKKKTCATRAEWAIIRKDQKENVEQLQRQGTMVCTPDSQSSSSGMRC